MKTLSACSALVTNWETGWLATTKRVEEFHLPVVCDLSCRMMNRLLAGAVEAGRG
jgi:hypothetical protein